MNYAENLSNYGLFYFAFLIKWLKSETYTIMGLFHQLRCNFVAKWYERIQENVSEYEPYQA